MPTYSDRITTAIVDDEPLARRRIRQLLEEHADFHIIGEVATAMRAERMLLTEKPDVTFLDVQLGDADGLDLLSRLGTRYGGQTIFITAYGEHAVRAFDTPALDYLVKPLERDRFDRAIERIRRNLAADRAVVPTPDAQPRRLAVNAGDGRLRLLPIGRIDWIESAGNYVRIHAGSVSETFRDTLGAVERRLDGQQFVRVHRSSIVNIDRITHLEPNGYGDYVLTLEDGTEVPLSRRYSERIELVLGHL